jgi:nucleoid-associated protein YgaU
LQEENARLKSDLDRTRSENTTLGDQLRQVAAQNEQSRQALEMLNGELLAQKEARTRAEQAAEAVRTQLKVVLTQGAGAAPQSLAAARASSAHSTSALQLTRSPSGELTASAELRADTERLRRAAAGTPADPPPPSRPSAYIVQSGDTLEKIALKHYGVAEQWRAIYEANQTLLADGQPLRIGMEIRLP